MINAIQIALSGLTAASRKVEASASNIANLGTVGSLTDPARAPYTPVTAQQTSVTGPDGAGLGVASTLVPKNTPFVPAYDPGSPFADDAGIVGVPNVDLAEEAVNLSLAEISYKASAKVIGVIDDLADELLKTFDRKV